MYEGVLQDLIDELGRLPGVGPKGAQRIAFHLLAADAADVRRLAETMVEVKDKARFCEVCGNVSEDTRCRICRDPRRDDSVICVVEESKDVQALERTKEFRGRYHVLGGAISPLEGIGPDQLRIRELMRRLEDGAITEIILAMDPNIEGDATAAYRANPDAWNATSPEAEKIARLTGARQEDVPSLLKGYTFPTLEEQAGEALLGGGTAKAVADTSAFLLEQGKIPAALSDYSPYVSARWVTDAAKPSQ